MIKISRRWLAFISITFGLFLTVVGALRFENFNNYLWALSSSILYLVCLLITTLAFKSDRMSNWAAWLNIAAVIYIPVVLHVTHIGPVTGDYDTWYVTALAVLFGSMIVREQIKLAIAAPHWCWLLEPHLPWHLALFQRQHMAQPQFTN